MPPPFRYQLNCLLRCVPQQPPAMHAAPKCVPGIARNVIKASACVLCGAVPAALLVAPALGVPSWRAPHACSAPQPLGWAASGGRCGPFPACSIPSARAYPITSPDELHSVGEVAAA